jgi:threonine synthase
LFKNTFLECINCGFMTDLLSERKFRCPHCNNLYDVVHDIPGRSPKEWKDWFEDRHHWKKINSGVWKFKDWIMPELKNEDIVTLGEGFVPIVPAGPNLKKWVGGDIDIWLILEGKSPSGSFKDFGMTVLVSVAKAAGIKNIVCASTGDTSASLAAYCGAAGIKCVVVLPQGKITQEQVLQVKLFGATVILLPGNFDACMKVLEELVHLFGAYPGNSLNPARIEGHQATVFLTAQFFNWNFPDWFVLPIGNGSNTSSVGKALRFLKKLGFNAKSKILGCQSEAANPLYLSWLKKSEGMITEKEWLRFYSATEVGETIATAARIGDPVSYKKVIREIVASEGRMAEAIEPLLKEAVIVCAKDGYFVCPQTGIAIAGLKRSVMRGYVKPGERAVIVSTADGLKFTQPFASFEGNVISTPDCKTETVAKILGI